MMAATLMMTPAQRAIYEQLLRAARTIGPFKEDRKRQRVAGTIFMTLCAPTQADIIPPTE